MTVYKRITPYSLISDDREYAVIAVYKDTREVVPAPKFTGNYDECLDYIGRNISPDNIEQYHIAVAS